MSESTLYTLPDVYSFASAAQQKALLDLVTARGAGVDIEGIKVIAMANPKTPIADELADLEHSTRPFSELLGDAIDAFGRGEIDLEDIPDFPESFRNHIDDLGPVLREELIHVAHGLPWASIRELGTHLEMGAKLVRGEDFPMTELKPGFKLEVNGPADMILGGKEFPTWEPKSFRGKWVYNNLLLEYVWEIHKDEIEADASKVAEQAEIYITASRGGSGARPAPSADHISDFAADYLDGDFADMLKFIDDDYVDIPMSEKLAEIKTRDRSKMLAQKAQRMNRQKNSYKPAPPRRHQGR